MKITSEKQGEEHCLALAGRLDATTAPQLEEAVKQALEAGVQKLKLDLKEMPYISSAGLRVLLVAQKQMMKRQGMRLVNVGETVLDVFKMTGFADILTIE